ncbi:MAG: hypothetical protein WC943_03790 [Elusimicrobiota bacterium]|jgi:hypothetical protein
MEDTPQPRRPLPKDASEVEAIADLQTCRMALRWALERIRSVEKEFGTVKDKAETEERQKRAAQDDLAGLQRTFNYYAERLKEAEEKVRVLGERLATAQSEAAQTAASALPAPPSVEVQASPELGASPLSLRQSYDERLAALQAEHAAQMAEVRKNVEAAAGEMVRKVGLMAANERERFMDQLAYERETRERALAELERKHQAVLAEERTKLENALTAPDSESRAALEAARDRAAQAESRAAELTAQADDLRRSIDAAVQAGLRAAAQERESAKTREARDAAAAELKLTDLAAAHEGAISVLEARLQAVIARQHAELTASRDALEQARRLAQERLERIDSVAAEERLAAEKDRKALRASFEREVSERESLLRGRITGLEEQVKAVHERSKTLDEELRAAQERLNQVLARPAIADEASAFR